MRIKRDSRGRVRDYQREYDTWGYGSSDKAKEDHKKRVYAKRAIGKTPKGKEIDHKKPLAKGGSNSKSNLRVISTHLNRGKDNKATHKKARTAKRIVNRAKNHI